MKIISIKPVGRRPVYDLSVSDEQYDNQHYVLENGVVTHNTGIMYSANQVFIIGKSQEKDGTELAGWKFTINIEKSRYVKEKAKLPFKVMYDGGIQKWSALFDLALESGHISKGGTQGWYNIVDMETGELIEPKRRLKDIEADDAFFQGLIKDEAFKKFVESRFKLNAANMQGESENAGNDDTI